ncbi:DUF418 domain-containing protein [Flavihumibacter solisilvae]|uniref:DUF418 domain-containing protein n=1 Tax=Flavihumibacter solisilvae TaxID=1349421 RepID=A0A0C1L5G6_9BACT|nr:DUF418 domain-containing protein [Flavihumibacter solisilvae]KIC95362.1 hypothetical protein OI18_07120 [Flavihumibacter solisilvae]
MSLVAPTQQKERIFVMDLLRGVALLGILMMNIPYFAESYQLGENIFIRNETSGADYYAWYIKALSFEGTMRALFSMLFGAGALLLLSRLEKKEMDITPADFYYRRLMWLLLFGLINAFVLQWPGDILYSYALCGLLLYPFRNMAARWLLIIGIFCMLVATFKETYSWRKAWMVKEKGEKALALQQQKKNLTEEQKEDLKTWQERQEKRKPANVMKEVEKERKEMRKGYFSITGHLNGINVKIETFKFYHFFIWDALACFFIGMALFKWGVITGMRSKKFYWILLITGYLVGFGINYFYIKTYLDIRMQFSYVYERLFINLYQERRLLQALGHMSLLILLHKYNILKMLQVWLSRVGQMAFTNYLMQSIICTTIFYGWGFGQFGQLRRVEWYYVMFVIWLFQVIFSNLWLHYFRFGPFEWLWRSLTYWKRQPMLKEEAVEKNIALA